MVKVAELPQQTTADGTEEILIIRGPVGARETRRMAAALVATAGTRPTPEELAAAILNTLVEGSNIDFVDNGDGTIGIAVTSSADFPGVPKADTAAPGTNTRQIATTAFVKAAVDVIANALSGKQATLVEGSNIDITDNGDGTFTIASTAGGGGGLVDGNYGGIIVSGGGTVMTVNAVNNVAVTVPDEAYGAGWNADMVPATKNALYAKFEAVAASISGRVASSAVGAANGVASLDGSGKVPTAQLPSYVDDVLEFSNTLAFPATGETGKIYIAMDTGKQSRWSGSAYVELTASPGTTDNVPEGATNKYYTDVRVRAAVMTGLADVAGTPAGTDTLLNALGKLRKGVFTDLPANYLAKAGGSMTGNLTLLGTVIVGRDAGDTVEYGRITFGVNGAYLRGSKINFQDVAGTQLATISANGDVTAIGLGDFTTPNSGTTGGLRLRGNATSALAYLQVTDATAAAQWGYWAFGSSGNADWNGAALKVNGVTVATTTDLAGKAPAFSTVNSYTTNQTCSDAAHNNNYNKMTGATTRTITFNSTPTAGHTSVWVNRGTVNMTIACAGGYYKNGASATATTNITLAPGGKLTAFHEGAGVWAFDGSGF